MVQRKVTDAIADKDGNISKVKLDGNKNYTSIQKAVSMADRGLLDNAHSVHPTNAKSHLRTNPDGKKSNNLDDMASD